MSTHLTYLDTYCERAGSALAMAEPANLVTNLFFIAAALVAIYAIVRLPPAPWRSRIDLSLLALSLLSIGIGSGLWHLKPTATTLLLDIIPITLFIHLYLISCMRRILQFEWPRVVLWWSVYVTLTVAMQLGFPPDLLNGTIMYVPTYLALVVLAGAVTTRSLYLGRIFASMVMVWTVSLVCRTLDNTLCETLISGTHFMWHTLNAFVLYRLLMALIRYRPPVSFVYPQLAE